MDVAPPRPILRLACLLHDIGKGRMPKGQEIPCVHDGHEKISAQVTDAVTKRLRLSNHQRKRIHYLVENHGLPLQANFHGPAIRRFLSRIDPRFLDDLFILSMASRKASGADRSEIRRLNDLWKRSKKILAAGAPLTVSQLAIKGDTVKQILGITEGVEIGHILTQLLDVVLEDPHKNNPQDLAMLLKKMEWS